MSETDELEELRKKKLSEMQQAQMSGGLKEQQNKFQEAQLQKQQIEHAAKSKLTKAALERFGNIKTADPEFADQIALLLLATERQQITDPELKRLLMIIKSRKKKINIKRI